MIRSGCKAPKNAVPILIGRPRSRLIAATFKAGFSRQRTANMFGVSLWCVDQSLRKWLRIS